MDEQSRMFQAPSDDDRVDPSSEHAGSAEPWAGAAVGRTRARRRAPQASPPQLVTRGDLTVFDPDPDLSQVVMRQTSWQYQRHVTGEAGAEDLDSVPPTEYLAMLRRGWFVLVFMALTAGFGSYWFFSQMAKTYSATATLLVNLPIASAAVSAAAAGADVPNDVSAATLLAKTYNKLVASPPILERVTARLGLTDPPTKLADRIKTRNENDTQIISVSAETDDPQSAADLANTVSEEFVAWLNEQEQAKLTRSFPALQESIQRARASIEQFTTEINAIRAAPGTRTSEERDRIAALDALRQQHLNSYNALIELQQRTERLQLTSQSPVSLIARADPPLRPTGRSVFISVAASILLALAAAATGLIARERLDRRVRSARDVMREVDLPVLAAVPRSSRASRVEIIASPRSRTSEIFRSLRTKLRFATQGHEFGSIVVTGPESDQGISAVAANLAVALAQSGQRVVLIDANLRKPRQHKLFGIAGSRGLSDLLADTNRHRETLAAGSGEIIRTVESRTDFESLLDRGSEVETLLVDGPVPRLRVLPAGTSTAAPADLLSSAVLDQITAVLGVVADVIVIDTPPLTGSADAMLIASAADHAVIVVEAGRTRPDALGAASANIAATGVNVLGVVLHGVEQGAAAA